MNEEIKKEIGSIVKKYNVLACPKSGVPKLTPSGNPSTVGLKVRKTKEANRQ